jgi:UDP-N-acetylmuramoyl-L-alanyl-D-glutamate--2,6-diaminopimelate ligase
MLLKRIKNLLHFFYSWYGSVKYHHPSEELLVIGITGTTGKSSVIHFLRQVLEDAGFKVGSLSTVDFYINGKTVLNDKKMTMVGKMFIQEKLREMVDAGCQIAIVETTSEGRLQHRHRFINYDTIVLTNLYPEHIEAHGGFLNYKRAKLDLFRYVSQCRRKDLKIERFKDLKIVKTAIVNGDCEFAEEFLEFNFDHKSTYNLKLITCNLLASGVEFESEGITYVAPVYGKHNIENLLAVIAVAKSLNIPQEKIQTAIAKIQPPPGRIEFIHEAEARSTGSGQAKGFQVIVDYAFEPVALQKLYDVVDMLEIKGKIIHVCGSTGGGRDKARREPIGRLVGEQADIFIITNEDPYDEDPQEIMNQVKIGALQAGKVEGQNLLMILDRREAIKKAIDLALPGDLVLITGKGSEQKMCIKNGQMIDWDDREIVRKFLI